jgi:uncharacterized membrane protein
MSFHLVHPALVHFTVAFLVVGGACEVWGILTRRDELARWGGQLILVGLASVGPTIVSGFLAANVVRIPREAQDLLAVHEQNGLILLALLLGIQFWKAWSGGKLGTTESRFYALLLVVAVALTIWGAWLGGQLVYVRGIGIR